MRAGIKSAIFALMCTSIMNAETIRIDFRGTVGTIAGSNGVVAGDYIGTQITEGTPYSGHYIFDSEAEDLGNGFVPNRAVYQFTDSPSEMVVEMGGFTFRTNPDDRLLVSTASNNAPPIGVVPGGDSYSVASAKDELVVGTNGLKDFRPEMVLQLVGGDEVRDGVDLLLTSEQHEMFPTATFAIQGIDPSNRDSSFLIHSGDVVFQAVPEPNSFYLLVLTLPLVIRRREIG